MNDLAIEKLVADLTNGQRWNWTKTIRMDDAAAIVLNKLVELGIIEGRFHPHTWSRHYVTFRANGKLFGRTDGITVENFDDLKR